MGKFDAIRKYYKKGDNVKVTSSFGECNGIIDELGDDYVVLKTKFGKITTLDAADIISVTKFVVQVKKHIKKNTTNKIELTEKKDNKTKPPQIIINNDPENKIKNINEKLAYETNRNNKSKLLLKKGQLYSSLCQYEEALKIYNELIKVSQELQVSNTRLSQYYAVYAGLIIKAEGNRENAIKYAELSLELNENNPSALGLLKKLKGIPSDNPDVEKELIEINEKLKNENSPNIKSNLLLKQGEHYSRLGRYEEALNAYKELIKVSEELLVSDARLSQFYAVYAGLILKTNGKRDDAKKYAELALELNEDNPSARGLLKSFGIIPNSYSSKKNNVYSNANTSKTIEGIKEIINNIDSLIREQQYDDVIYLINQSLKKELDLSQKCILIEKKAQCYNSLGQAHEAMNTYAELIKSKEKLGVSDGNLSQFYTIYANLVAQTGDMSNAVKFAEKAQKLNPNNNAASNLLERLNNGTYNNNSGNSELIIDSGNADSNIIVSPMIDFDIQECQYTNEEILLNNGKPTIQIADSMLEKAKEQRGIDMSDRYPLYLETAKAYKELGLESDDKYLECVAFYAMLKGNSLYLKFRDFVNKGEKEVKSLIRLKDSACSYYMEAWNLLSDIKPHYLVVVLCNYLKLNVAIANLESSQPVDFSGQFKNIFIKCINSDSERENQIVYHTIITIGASNIKVWNQLANLRNGTGALGSNFDNKEKKETAFEIINKIEKSDVDVTLRPSDFLKAIFKNRSERNANFKKFIKEIHTQKLELRSIDALINVWKNINEYIDLLYPTDIEIKNNVDKVLALIKPYFIRTTEIERTGLLYQAQRSIEILLKFINDNVTYYGRILFYPVLNQWLSNIKTLFDTKISQAKPKLLVSLDPKYILTDNQNINYISVVIKNSGESAAVGYLLDVMFINPNTQEHFTIDSIESNDEILVEENKTFRINIPTSNTLSPLTVVFQIVTYYLQQEIKAHYEYTIEKEPQTDLTYQDIIWEDGKVTKENLFKGRKKIISKLIEHYVNGERDKSYILYGLTRVGKSSILKYLKDGIDNKTVVINNHDYTIITFEIDFDDTKTICSTKEEFWEYFIMCIYKGMPEFIKGKYKLPSNIKAEELPNILHFFKENECYPIFMCDELSYLRNLIDNNILDSSFLNTLRKYSLHGLASFVYAGTYDIKDLINNPKYANTGTGQFVHTINEQIDKIDIPDADELIDVIKDKLSFTDEARKHIHKLSGDIPYFIQIICKNCGYYAVENNKRHIGYYELENVIKVLTGEEAPLNPDSKVVELSNAFHNNQYSPTDPPEVNVLLSCITYFNEGIIDNPRGISLSELQELWAKRRIEGYGAKLAKAIQLLIEKKVLLPNNDDGVIVYKLAVDLFRRWWSVHHPDINLEISTLQ